jgi:hypothetical protein
VNQHAHQTQQRAIERIHRIADIQPEIQRHLVIARACGVQSSCGRADQFGQPAFNVHVNVFER